ncbi:hypothetical protein CTAYLR_006467 [Chrysophaeum taylorii]|uniref:Uncharacterized protein n=1 Tax=Chrysophaeum taylorii TaxID=2483200 RepID=A0AAD7XQF1_9STRA|nr:hypothetical protein CTAYLR_006467 [Chrysophaeum taylorii]
MRLLTVNALKCTRKDVTGEGRLRLVATKIEVRTRRRESPQVADARGGLRQELLAARAADARRALPSDDPQTSAQWQSLRASATAIGVTSLPETLDKQIMIHARRTSSLDDAFLRALHHVLFDVHVIEGQLVCEETGQVFPIEEGRPNMMLAETHV